MSSFHPSRLDIEVRRYRTWSQTFFFEDSNGDPIDLSSYTVTAQVRKEEDYNSTLITNLTVDASDAVNGNITLSLTDAETGAINKVSGFWDMLFVAGADKETWIYGTFEFKESITNV